MKAQNCKEKYIVTFYNNSTGNAQLELDIKDAIQDVKDTVIETKEKDLQCKQCDYKCKRTNTLKKHINTQHGTEKVQPM